MHALHARQNFLSAAPPSPITCAVMPEETLWSGSSSQIKNVKPFAVCALALIAILALVGWLMKKDWGMSFSNYVLLLALAPIGVAIWKWLLVRSRKYQLTTERILVTSGIFNVVTDSNELYRVKDLRMTQPLLLRFFGLENIELTTSDVTSQFVCVDHVKKSEKLGDRIRVQVEACRVAKGSREMEIQ